MGLNYQGPQVANVALVAQRIVSIQSSKFDFEDDGTARPIGIVQSATDADDIPDVYIPFLGEIVTVDSNGAVAEGVEVGLAADGKAATTSASGKWNLGTSARAAAGDKLSLIWGPHLVA